MAPSRIAATLAVGFMAQAAASADFTDTAQVISANPIYERVAETRQECYTEATPAPSQPRERSVVAPILGGVAGALLGSQIGHGRGRDAAAAVGAVVGTVAADRVTNPNSDGSLAGAAVGGAAGAILGNQVGGGSGRTAATAAGAVAGAVAGDRVASSSAQHAQAQPVQRCKIVDAGTRDIIKGYSVVYRYNGRDITTTLPYQPGNTVPVRVAVGIIENGAPPAAATAIEPYDRNYATPVSRQQRSDGGYSYRY